MSRIEHIEVITLNNNCRLQLVGIPGGKTSLFCIGFHAGAMYENGFKEGSNDGISHFTEHMFFKGTPTLNSERVNAEFTRLGADLNAFTSYDHTVYFAKVPTRNLEKAAEIWNDLILNMRIDPDEFEAEKKVVLQEIQLYKDMPEFDANFSVRKYHFKNTPLEHNILGSLESVGSITPTMMEDYVKKHYSLDNAVITLAGGGFNFNEEKKFITSLFGKAKDGYRENPIYPPPIKMPSRKNKIEYYSKDSGKPLSYIALCWTSLGVSAQHFSSNLLLNTYIGNSRTSILYREIISKGVTSLCRFSFEAFHDVSSSSILFVAQPEKAKNVFDKIMETLTHLYELKFTDDMVSDLKEETWGSYYSEIEDPSNYGLDLTQKHIKFRKPFFPNDFKKYIDISKSELQETKDSIFESLNLTVYSTGSVPPDWEPDFPSSSPW
ncbi:MAG: M16 family metallopeptidase [Candidatus Hodarchaeales archaeon]